MDNEMKPLKLCANGCGVPPAPPSKVICKVCQEKITANMKDILRRMEKKS